MHVRLLLFLSSLLLLQSSATASNRPFERSDSLFKIYINSDTRKAFTELEQQARLTEGPEDRAEYQLNRGLLFMRQGKIDSALAVNWEGIQLSSDASRRGRGFRYRGRLYHVIDQQDSAVACFKRSLRYFPSSEVHERLKVNQNLAQTYLRLHQPDSTRRYLNRGRKILAEQEEGLFIDRKAGYASMTGQLQLYLSHYDSAMSSYKEALDHYSVIGNQRAQGSALAQMADIFSRQEKHREAVGYYKRAFEAVEGIHDRTLMASYSNNLGLVYIGLEAPDSATFCFLRALTLARASGLRRLQGNCHGNLAHLHLEAEHFDSAYHHSTASNRVFSELGDDYGLCLSLLSLGEINTQLGRAAEGRQQLRQARSLAESLNLLELKKDSYFALSQAHERHGRADSALIFFRQYTDVRDSMASASVKKEIERLQIEYETRLQEEENARLTAELGWEVEKGQRDRLTFIVVGVSAALLLISLVVMLYFRSQARKRQLIITRAETEKEKSEKALAQKRLATALRQITEKDKLMERLEEDYRESVSEGAFADKLHERINSNADWMQFVIEFEMVYKGFFDSLLPKENKLTKNDLRMAALIKLNLSNKEIAEVLHITLEGVKKAKHRLKKKLQLQADQNLADFVAHVKH